MKGVPLDLIGQLFILIIRSIVFYVLIPGGLLVWLFGTPWFIRQRVGPGLLLGWIDLNFIVLLVRTVFRPFAVGELPPWVPWSDVNTVTHRIGRLD